MSGRGWTPFFHSFRSSVSDWTPAPDPGAHVGSAPHCTVRLGRGSCGNRGEPPVFMRPVAAVILTPLALLAFLCYFLSRDVGSVPLPSRPPESLKQELGVRACSKSLWQPLRAALGVTACLGGRITPILHGMSGIQRNGSLGWIPWVPLGPLGKAVLIRAVRRIPSLFFSASFFRVTLQIQCRRSSGDS